MNAKGTKIKGSIPEHYDQGLAPNIFQDFGRDLSRRIVALNPHKVLELAAGTGVVTRILRDTLNASCQLTATDIVDPMLSCAKSKFDANESIEIEVADAQKLPFEDNSFDALVSQFGVMFFSNKERSFEEASRVLSANGHYIFKKEVFEGFSGAFSLEKHLLPTLVENQGLGAFRVKNDNFIDMGIPDDYKKLNKIFMDGE